MGLPVHSKHVASLIATFVLLSREGLEYYVQVNVPLLKKYTKAMASCIYNSQYLL